MKGVILTAGEMRSAEAAAIEAGTPVETLMERAGMAAAEAVWRFAGPLPTLILCGPGNNGGDGYVIARGLSERGVDVRVAALAEPQSPAAKWAAGEWGGAIEPFREAGSAPLLIDAVFGTGLRRPLDEAAVATLNRLAGSAALRVAVDLPSGVATDDGSILSPVPDYDLTVTFATLKPSHLLQPAARHMGRIAIADIGLEAESRLHAVRRPVLAGPGPDHHKYSRGYVGVVAGELPGAAALAAAAAMRSGAGYVRLVGERPIGGIPSAVVQSSGLDHLSDPRVGAAVLGPGLGRSEQARALLETALGCGRPLVLDADALVLLDLATLQELPHVPILTPHAGEFGKLFGVTEGSKVEQARAAAARSGAVILFKGADTVIAAPDGRAAVAAPPSWLASAGTGDVLTGIIAAQRATGLDSFEAACAGAWIHGRAADFAGRAMIADDLIDRLPAVLAECS